MSKSAQILNYALTIFLKKLSPDSPHLRHRAEWEASKIDPEICDRNFWTIEDPREVDKLLNRNTKTRWKHSDLLVPGWAVAGVDPLTGERIFSGVQFKPDKPLQDPDTGKFRKYISPSKQVLSPLFLEMADYDYWPKLKADTSQAIAICEGAKKAGALLTVGIPAISIPGVSTGAKLGRLRPELEAFCAYGRKFMLFFDRDVVDKREVRLALHNLGRLLAAKGCVIEVVEWDNRYKGIDDFIASGGDVHQRIRVSKTLEEWKEDAEASADAADGETCTLARRYEMVAKRLKGRLRYNALKGKVELDGESVDLSTLRIQLAITYNIQLPSEDCNQICLYLAQQQSFSPVAEYLHECGQTYPADDELLNSLASNYLGTDEALHRTFLRKTLLSAVARALTPGCKVDTVCILQGLQGCGKSTFWKVLASEPWFDDTVSNAGDKDERLKLHQSWFVEWAELEAIFKRKDISAVKAFITTQTDQVRPPYGRDILEMQRPSIIVGSTNETEFLADPTGNRRYWVIPVQTDSIPLEQLAQNRDRIWAAAYHAFKSGEDWTLPPEMRMVASADASNYSFSDPWEEVVCTYADEKKRITVTEVLTNALRLEIHQMDKRSEMRVTNILKQLGWGSSRGVVQGRRVRVWENPKFTEIGCPGCPQEAESLMDVSGQPDGQPPGQPHGQPPENSQNSPVADRTNSGVDNLDNLDNPFPKSSRSQDSHKCSVSEPLIKVHAQESPLLPPLTPGTRVKILAGTFEGKRGEIQAVEGGGYIVLGDGWAITRPYRRDELAVLVEVARG